MTCERWYERVDGRSHFLRAKLSARAVRALSGEPSEVALDSGADLIGVLVVQRSNRAPCDGETGGRIYSGLGDVEGAALAERGANVDALRSNIEVLHRRPDQAR